MSQIANICDYFFNRDRCNIAMDSPYDSDVSEDTRDLIARGLATNTRRYNVVGEMGSNERDSAPNRSMNTQYFHLPPTHVVKVEEPSARGLNMTSGENVQGQIYNITLTQSM